ncbi:apolipoprotein N-acyltransferase [Legionella oakridgensis ATCC 33761 = DSM 21215]|uniref:Apolipoprotein N-acyltransferase n=3 Tax=Legionella oakridgensis TaxID=29423 RepID=W0BEQ7_9GAMM|nr:apolipoprotein N-acyltransferase [Legionella oakridgensis ATCC 33761 = DSM 21215]KTD38016.1 apolipoprotein N-acyltransferase [Legionella oakridgensis]STY20262.1 apolipoprotein N-acyltransferase [Legionella longbeachae]
MTFATNSSIVTAFIYLPVKMTQTTATNWLPAAHSSSYRYVYLFPAVLAGLLFPLGFAPFHLPGLAILGIAILFGLLHHASLRHAFYIGFVFGLSSAGLGVSWVYISIHEYGHLHSLGSATITLFFVAYLALYPALITFVYKKLSPKRSFIFSCLLFSALWCLGEFLRATIMGGFPWLLLGFGQTDTPLRYLLPILGVYGASFFACLSATFLATGALSGRYKQYPWFIAFALVLLCPSLLKNQAWGTASASPISVGIIQANLSMRDKWDESLFWQLQQYYQTTTEQLIGKNQLIVMPESAIPVPASYISDFLDTLDNKAQQNGSAILLGILQPAGADEMQLYNAMVSLGQAKGSYLKQHLVPFGEFIPRPFQQLIEWLSLPTANMNHGKKNQSLIEVQNHPIAALICYELAYPLLLRNQLPRAEWIVSISDDGWFGHSFAMYQQLQMAQALSIQTARFQVVANNDGLSSVIDANGDVLASLPAFTAGTLEAMIQPLTGASPWVYLGDLPILLISLFIFSMALLNKKSNR